MKNVGIETFAKDQIVVTVGGEQHKFFSNDLSIALWDMEKRELYLFKDNWENWKDNKTTIKYFEKFINKYTQFTFVNKKKFEEEIKKGFINFL